MKNKKYSIFAMFLSCCLFATNVFAVQAKKTPRKNAINSNKPKGRLFVAQTKKTPRKDSISSNESKKSSQKNYEKISGFLKSYGLAIGGGTLLSVFLISYFCRTGEANHTFEENKLVSEITETKSKDKLVSKITEIGGENEDPYNLNRFIKAIEVQYSSVKSELKSGEKTSHWIWYFFPNVKGLGLSNTSRLYAIKSKKEAIAFLNNNYLFQILSELTNIVIDYKAKHKQATLSKIFGGLDRMKFISCMTLFSRVLSESSRINESDIFSQALRAFGEGFDNRTDEIMRNKDF